MFSDAKRLRRMRVLQARWEGKLTEVEAARVLGLSPRWVRKLVAAFRIGNVDVVADRRGGTRRVQLERSLQDRICALKRERPDRNNPQIAEMIEEELKVVVHPNTVHKSKIPIYRGL